MTQNQQDDLYVVGEGTPSGIVKIGRSGNVKVRLPGIQTGNPAKLQILHLEPGAGHFEVPLHNRFADIRLEGEWFDFGNEDPLVCVVAAIKELMLARFCTQGEMDRRLPMPEARQGMRLSPRQKVAWTPGSGSSATS